MAHLILPPGWRIPERQATPEAVYQGRRRFVKQLGLGGVGLAAASMGLGCESHLVRPLRDEGLIPANPLATIPLEATRAGLPAMPNPAFTVPERPLTTRLAAASHNNFYEFEDDAKSVWQKVGKYEPFPWTIQVDGLVQRPLTLDVDALIREMALEERVYRHRCVETWAMTVPWTGFPLRKLIERCAPLSSATHVRFISAQRNDEMPGIETLFWYPWPYYEGLRMDEALNELAFVATGIYGAPLPKQHGSPLRVVLPWKYGFKGPKAVEQITFVNAEPPTFWHDAVPNEYGFLSNVDPAVPHPRWSQATESLLGVEGRIPTQRYNGYEAWVEALYPDAPLG